MNGFITETVDVLKWNCTKEIRETMKKIAIPGCDAIIEQKKQ